MYRAVSFEDLPLFGSTRQWKRLQDLKSWAERQGLTLKREVSMSDVSRPNWPESVAHLLDLHIGA